MEKEADYLFNLFVQDNDNKNKEIRGDLIQFYNEVFDLKTFFVRVIVLHYGFFYFKIYLKNMKTYVKLYISGENKATPNLTLSPIPKIGMQTFSPRKVSETQSVYISPGKQQVQVQRPKLTWSFSNSFYQVSRAPITVRVRAKTSKCKTFT
jgi:hypothetical protein